jgi:hypothetical protein
MRKTGKQLLRPHFAEVRVVELDGSLDLTAEDMRHYVEHSVAHRDSADAVPDFAGTRRVTTSSAVFVATRAGKTPGGQTRVRHRVETVTTSRRATR